MKQSRVRSRRRSSRSRRGRAARSRAPGWLGAGADGALAGPAGLAARRRGRSPGAEPGGAASGRCPPAGARRLRTGSQPRSVRYKHFRHWRRRAGRGERPRLPPAFPAGRGPSARRSRPPGAAPARTSARAAAGARWPRASGRDRSRRCRRPGSARPARTARPGRSAPRPGPAACRAGRWRSASGTEASTIRSRNRSSMSVANRRGSWPPSMTRLTARNTAAPSPAANAPTISSSRLASV